MPYRALRRSPVAAAFPPPDWDLLVRLPGRVLVAATAADRSTGGAGAGADGRADRWSVADTIAGIDAIAAGRASASGVVAGIVAAIFAEQIGEGDPGEFLQPRSGIANVLADARTAARAVDRRASGTDTAAYRDWLVRVAVAGCWRPPSPAGRRFQVDLTLAMTL